jgi:hypothetical protein
VLVPTIDARQAQATVESDRVRIFKEITDSIGMEAFNSQLQEYLERGLRGVATEALLQKGGVESLPAGGSKVTMGILRGDLEQLKQLQQDTQQQVQAVATQQQDTKQEVQETKRELTVLTALQEDTKQEIQQRMSTIERKLDVLLGLLAGGVAATPAAAPAAAGATEDSNTQ